MEIQELLDDLAEDEYKDLGNFIEDKREGLEVSQRQFCRALKVERRSLQRIENGEAKSVDPMILVKLSALLDADLSELMRIYARGRSEEEEVKWAKRAGFILRHFDLPRLRDIGLTSTAADLEHVEERITTFFGYDSILDYDRELPATAFSDVDYGVSQRMQRLWMSTVHRQFRELDNPHEYDPDRVEEVTTKIRGFTFDAENGFVQFIRELFEAGLTVIVERYVQNTAVYGGTMEVGGKPCVVITDRDKRYDRLWRTLAHEIWHVLNDFDQIRKVGYHVTGEQSLFDAEMEEDADRFAAEIFVPEARRDEIRPNIDVPGVVKRKSEKWGVHPALVYGLHLDVDLSEAPDDYREREYSKYRNNIPDSAIALQQFKNLSTSTWQRERLEETIPLLQETIDPREAAA